MRFKMKQITEKQKENVLKFIKSFKKENKIIPILLVESGSRMWKFASEDSDFDIRGFHISNLENELSISEKTSQLEFLEKDMDIVSYDIDKFFNLIVSSNPNLLEQIQSDIVYENKFKELGVNYEEFKNKILENVNLKRLFHHYLSMAHKNFDKFKDTKFTYKKSLYVLRSLYCALYTVKIKKVPPVIFEEVIETLKLKESIKILIKEIIEKKMKVSEKTELVEKKEIFEVINNLFKELENYSIDKNDNSKNLRKYLDFIAIDIKKKLFSMEAI